ncbi:hypothetical protein [Azonexus sp.]|uniref:hypothetical protein n=1 Tax=Azonexus sp. TaxID=1872668 RepID=UPI0035B0C767
MSRPFFLLLCLLVGIWCGAAATLQWAKHTPRPQTPLTDAGRAGGRLVSLPVDFQQSAGFFPSLLKGDHDAEERS